jgi:hypothetical protein
MHTAGRTPPPSKNATLYSCLRFLLYRSLIHLKIGSDLFLETLALRAPHAKWIFGSSYSEFGPMTSEEGDMEIVIGKIFFLVSSAWAVTVFYKVTSSMVARRNRD